MKRLNVRETREQISRLLDAVAAGEKVIVMRRGRAEDNGIRFPDRAALRAELPPMGESAAENVRALRDEARFF